MLTLGAIAASFTTERIWYIDQLSHLVEAMGIQEWLTLETICCRFLWWKPVCNEPGQRLWDEMSTTSIHEARAMEVNKSRTEESLRDSSKQPPKGSQRFYRSQDV